MIRFQHRAHLEEDKTLTGESIVLAQKLFEETYCCEPAAPAFTSYRMCPLVAHSAHQLGHITGLAINKGIHIVTNSKRTVNT